MVFLGANSCSCTSTHVAEDAGNGLPWLWVARQARVFETLDVEGANTICSAVSGLVAKTVQPDCNIFCATSKSPRFHGH